MKTKILFLFLVIALPAILGFNSCNSNNSPTSPSESAFLMPLKVGNMWTYIYNRYDSLNNKITTSDTTYIYADSIINGETWYCLIHSERILSRNDGLYRMMQDSNGNNAPGLFFKYPADVGDKWKTGYGIITFYYTLLSKGESVSVPAGNFSCYIYKMEHFDNDSTSGFTSYSKKLSWLCPGKGTIKVELWTSYNNGTLFLAGSEELQNYDLK